MGISNTMQFLNQKIIRENRCLVLSTGKTVWKVPVSVSTWKEVSLERKMVATAGRDSNFAPHLPSYGFIFGISRTPYLESLAGRAQKDRIMRGYFEKAFADSSTWPQAALKSLSVLSEFENFLRNHTQENPEFWDGVLNKTVVRKSSSHGDFHMDHIFLDGERLCFIDWTQYSANSSRYFDLVNFWIFWQKQRGESWMDVWKRHFQNPPTQLFGVTISPSDFFAYAVWKVSAELKLLGLRGRIDERKQGKYRAFISSLAQASSLEKLRI